MRLTRFSGFALATLAANLFVIVWGAYVRASGSGAGCGSHWPLCNGEVIPRAPGVQTLVELTHRATSGVALLMVLALAVWAFRASPRGHAAPVRWGAALSLLFIVVEALVGAGLVLFELVLHNASVARAWWMAAHLVNTFLLLAALTLTVWWSATGRPFAVRGQGWRAVALGVGALALLTLGASGGVAALGDTLYLAAIANQLVVSPAVELLVSLRVYHPLLAVVVGALVTTLALALARTRPTPVQMTHAWGPRQLAILLAILYVVQLGAGALNVVLLAPIWLQLLHLLLADAVWITFVLLGAATLATVPAAHVARSPIGAPVPSPVPRQSAPPDPDARESRAPRLGHVLPPVTRS